MRRYLAVAFALFALLLFTPQPAVAAPSENDVLTVPTEILQPAQVAIAAVMENVEVAVLAVLRGEPCATARQRPPAPFTATVAPLTDNQTVRTDTLLLLDHRWTLRAATGRTAAGIL